jgi:DNA-binding MarR family transcriptional regulator
MPDEKANPPLHNGLLAAAASVRAMLEDAWRSDEAGAIGLPGARALEGLAAPAQLTGLARELGMTKQAASEIVDRLLAAELVEKEPMPGDGRAKRLILTRKGRAALARWRAAGSRVNDALLDRLGQKKHERLQRYLALLAETNEP